LRHQGGNELVGGQRAERVVFRRNNHIEPASRAGNLPTVSQAIECQLDGVAGRSRLSARVLGRKEVSAAPHKVCEVTLETGSLIRFHYRKVSKYDTLRNYILNTRGFHGVCRQHAPNPGAPTCMDTTMPSTMNSSVVRRAGRSRSTSILITSAPSPPQPSREVWLRMFGEGE
jgi:hypothetical protein